MYLYLLVYDLLVYDLLVYDLLVYDLLVNFNYILFYLKEYSYLI